MRRKWWRWRGVKIEDTVEGTETPAGGSARGADCRQPDMGDTTRRKTVARETFRRPAAFQMSQAVEGPILPENSPDREVNCEVALEAAFAALVASAEAQGWTPDATASTLLKIYHAQKAETVAAAAGTDKTATETGA